MSALTDTLVAVADAVRAQRDELNRLDGIAGDGDLGITMTTAADALTAILPEVAALDFAPGLRRVGSELARKAPSTSGTLIATGFLRAGKAAGEIPQDPSPVTVLAACVAAAATGIGERGKVALGDTTMLDALLPASESLQTAASQRDSLAIALNRAADAARAGAEATKGMQAKAGRAGWLAERSQGNEDAGAHLIATIFSTAAIHVKNSA